jgi:hypothetical protein
MTQRQAAILTMVGGALVGVGSLLPWATVSSAFGSISVNGIEGDGVFTLILGGAITLLGFLAYGGAAPRMLTFLLAIAALGLGGFELINISSRLGDAGSEFVRASVGVGVYLIVAGALAAVLGNVAARRAVIAPAAPTGTPTPAHSD